MYKEGVKMSKYDDLSLGDLLNGLILYNPDQKFSEQQINMFFFDLSKQDPGLKKRLHFKGSMTSLYSESIRRILSFREMGKLLEIPPPNPVQQFYRPRKAQLESLKVDLERRCLLPTYETTLKEIAKEFKASLQK
jgi:hypothetical protein